MTFRTDKEKALYDTASRNFRAGYNCAEALFRAFCSEMPLQVNEESLKLASGFGGGITYPEGPCGAAAGGVMVLSLMAGRTEPTQDKKPMKVLIHDFVTLFTETFGAMSCGCLTKYEIGTAAQKENCHAITAEAAAMLMRFIEERGLQSGT